MITKTVKRYYCDCGKGFFKKSSCLSHESNCTSWKNPKNKSCKTCVYSQFVRTEYVDGYVFSDAYYDCTNKDFDEHSGAPHGVDYISQNCPMWSQK